MRFLALSTLLATLCLCPQVMALPVGITQVSPVPGAEAVPLDSDLSMTFVVPASYAYTEGRKLRLIESDTGIEIFSTDPGAGHTQEGSTSFEIDLPENSLKPGTGYHVTLDQGFAVINQAPWKTGAHDGSEWMFTTADIHSAVIGIDNVVSVYPAPGSIMVPVDTVLTVQYPAPANYGYTEGRHLVVRDIDSQLVVFETDPEITDPQQGSDTFTVTLPAGTLEPERNYEVTMDFAFAGINLEPWKTGAIDGGVWVFRTGVEDPAPTSSIVDGLLAVSPAPGSQNVDPSVSLKMFFSADPSFLNTDGNSLRVIEVATQQEVYAFDPDESHPEEGARRFEVDLPAGTLKPETEYTVQLDYQFAFFNSAPWRTTALSNSDWTFVTKALSPEPLPAPADGIIAVYPAPGQVNVSPDTEVAVHFADRTFFGYTEDRRLSIIDTRDDSVVASVDPLYLDEQEGGWAYIMAPGPTLVEGVSYRAELDALFSRFNAAPWTSQAANWTFTIAGNLTPPLETPSQPPAEPPAEPPSAEPPEEAPPVENPIAGGDPENPSEPEVPTEPETPAGPVVPQITETTQSVMFVTQTPPTGSFGTVVSNFSNHVATAIRTPRGGDLWIRYPDGTARNLTAEAGFGEDGEQGAAAIAVRKPSMHWDGSKAIFSMVIGSPGLYELTDYYWQLYEVTGFGQGEQVAITKVPNQPVDYNNVSPIYAATNEDIIFVSDITPGGRHLYPQYEEYDGAATNTGMFRLTPTTGELKRLSHAPSGDFTPIIDDFGRLIFVRWDHLQQDQQNGDLIGGVERFGTAINYVDESPNAPVDTVNGAVEVFPEHLVELNPETSTPYVVGNETGHRFNQFFLWESSPLDGSHNEVLNHLGRQELGQSYTRGRYVDDGALTDITSSILGGHTANSVSIYAPGGTFHPVESPTVSGRFYMTHAQEFSFCGEVIRVDAPPTANPEDIVFEKVTEFFDTEVIDGCYRNPLPLSDNTMVAAWAASDFANQSDEEGGFRLRFINEDGTPGGFLTGGISETVSYYNPDFLISHTGDLWELDPVEVRSRPRPNTVLAQSTALEAPEQAACEAALGDACGEVMTELREYLRDNKLALVVSRNVTARDDSDTQQPFNLRVPGGVVSDSSFGNEKVYDVTHLQFLQANLVRGYTNRASGRRPLAQYIPDDLAEGVNQSIEGAVELGSDGSVVAVVPAERAVTWHLIDETQNNQSVVSERYWVNFAAGEVRVCANCHGINNQDQMGNPPPVNVPSALSQFLTRWQAEQSPID